MNKYGDMFKVKEENIDINVVKNWFTTFEEIADVIERDDICFPFDELIRENEEFLEHIVLKTNKKCGLTDKYVSRIALKEFMGIQYP